MTRINVGIKPAELPNKLLLAELREIKRIPNIIKSKNFSCKDQPPTFTLGKGHVKFFYTRLGYLKVRYDALYTEAKKRNFNVKYYGSSWDNIPIQFKNYYKETPTDRTLLINRIKEKGHSLNDTSRNSICN